MNANSAPDLMKVVRLSISLAFSGLAGFMASIRQINPHARFEFDWLVVLALVLGAYFGFLLCKVILPSEEGAGTHTVERRRQRLMKLSFFGLLPCGAILAGLFFLVGDASSARQYDYFIGFTGAVIFLTLLGYMLTKVVGFFEHSSENAVDHR